MGCGSSEVEQEIKEVLELTRPEEANNKNQPVKNPNGKYQYNIHFEHEKIFKFYEFYKRIAALTRNKWGNEEQVKQFGADLGILSFPYAKKLFQAFINIENMVIYNTEENIQQVIDDLKHQNDDVQPEEEAKAEKEKKEEEE